MPALPTACPARAQVINHFSDEGMISWDEKRKLSARYYGLDESRLTKQQMENATQLPVGDIIREVRALAYARLAFRSLTPCVQERERARMMAALAMQQKQQEFAMAQDAFEIAKKQAGTPLPLSPPGSAGLTRRVRGQASSARPPTESRRPSRSPRSPPRATCPAWTRLRRAHSPIPSLAPLTRCDLTAPRLVQVTPTYLAGAFTANGKSGVGNGRSSALSGGKSKPGGLGKRSNTGNAARKGLKRQKHD